jgi:hypothetical protein
LLIFLVPLYFPGSQDSFGLDEAFDFTSEQVFLILKAPEVVAIGGLTIFLACLFSFKKRKYLGRLALSDCLCLSRFFGLLGDGLGASAVVQAFDGLLSPHVLLEAILISACSVAVHWHVG